MAVTFDEATKSYTDGVTTLELKNGAYEIGTVEQLKLFRDAVNEGNSFAKATVKLTADIDLENEEWTPIGTQANAFAGIFDGGGHTVSNLYINQPSMVDVGFFGYTRDGEIRNLTIENADVTGYLDVGAVAGTPYTSKYTNITLAGTVKVEGYSYVGGMLGKNAYADLTGLTVDAAAGSYVKAESENYRSYVGGVVGFMGEGNITVKDVASNINVIGSTCDIGGIVGIAHYGNKFINVICTAELIQLVNASDEGDHLEIGGIAGVWHNESGQTVLLLNCSAENTTLKSSLNGEDRSEEVKGNDITGKSYNSESSTSGSLIIGNVRTTETGSEFVFTVSGPKAADDLKAIFGDSLQDNGDGTYTSTTFDMSAIYVNEAWAGKKNGDMVEYGVIGVNAFAKADDAINAAGADATIKIQDARDYNTPITRVSYTENLTIETQKDDYSQLYMTVSGTTYTYGEEDENGNAVRHNATVEYKGQDIFFGGHSHFESLAGMTVKFTSTEVTHEGGTPFFKVYGDSNVVFDGANYANDNGNLWFYVSGQLDLQNSSNLATDGGSGFRILAAGGKVNVDKSSLLRVIGSNISIGSYYVYSDKTAKAVVGGKKQGHDADGNNDYSATLNITNGSGLVNENGIVRVGASYILDNATTDELEGLIITDNPDKPANYADLVKACLNITDASAAELDRLYVDGNGAVTIRNSELTANSITLADGSSLTLDVESTVTVGALAAADGTITIDASSYTSGLYKLIDVTGYGKVDYSRILTAFGENLSVVDNDLWIGSVDRSTLLVNSDFAGKYNVGDPIVDQEGFFYGFNAFASAGTMFDNIRDTTTTLKLFGEQELVTDAATGAANNRNFNIRAKQDLSLTADDAATLTLTVKDSSWEHGGSTNNVGELAFLSDSDDAVQTITIGENVTIDTNAKIWFGRTAVTKEVHATNVVINGTIIQKPHKDAASEHPNASLYGIHQIQVEKGSTVTLNGSMLFGWSLLVKGGIFNVTENASLTWDVDAFAQTNGNVEVESRDTTGGQFNVSGSKNVKLRSLTIKDNASSASFSNGAEALFIDYITLADGSSLTLDAASAVTTGTLTNNGTITIDATGVTGGTRKVIDTDSIVNNGSISVKEGTLADNMTLVTVDNDFYVTDQDQSIIYVGGVNAAGEKSANTAVPAEALQGWNKFDTMKDAFKAGALGNNTIDFGNAGRVVSDKAFTNTKETVELGEGEYTIINGKGAYLPRLTMNARDVVINIKNAHVTLSKYRSGKDSNGELGGAVLNITDSRVDGGNEVDGLMWVTSYADSIIEIANSRVGLRDSYTGEAENVTLGNTGSYLDWGSYGNLALKVSGTAVIKDSTIFAGYYFSTIGDADGATIDVTNSVVYASAVETDGTNGMASLHLNNSALRQSGWGNGTENYNFLIKKGATVSLTNGSNLWWARAAQVRSPYGGDLRDSVVIDADGTLELFGGSTAEVGNITNNGELVIYKSTLKALTVTNNGYFAVNGISSITAEFAAAGTGFITLQDAVFGADTVINASASYTNQGIGSEIVMFGANTLANGAKVSTGWSKDLRIGFGTNFPTASIYITSGAKLTVGGNTYIGSVTEDQSDAAYTVFVTGKDSEFNGSGAGGDLYLRADGMLTIENNASASFTYFNGKGVLNVLNATFKSLNFNIADSGRLTFANGAKATLGSSDDAKKNSTARGDISVQGDDAELTLIGDIKYGRTSTAADFTVKNNATVTVNGNIEIGYFTQISGAMSFYKGSLSLADNARFTATGTITVFLESALAMDYTSRLTFAGLTAQEDSITINVSGYTDGVYKVMENTGANAVDYATVISNWSEIENIGYAIVDNSLYLGKADQENYLVNADYSKYNFGDAIEDKAGYFYGFNAFSSLDEAGRAAKEATRTITVEADLAEDVNTPLFDLKGDLILTAETAVTVTWNVIGNAADAPDTDGKFYLVSKDGQNHTFTIGENVTLNVPASSWGGAFYVGYQSIWATKLNIDGKVNTYLFYIGAKSEVTISETGSLMTTSENLIMRWDSKLTVNGNGTLDESNPQVKLSYASIQGGDLVLNNTVMNAGSWLQMWNRNKEDGKQAPTLSLDNSTLVANSLKAKDAEEVLISAANDSKINISGSAENTGTITLKTGSAFIAGTFTSSGAIVMDSSSSIMVAGVFTSTGTITVEVDAAQSGVSFVRKLVNASTLTVNDSLTVEGGRDGAQLVAAGNALWLDNSDKSTILINSAYTGEIGSAIAGRDGYFFGFNALTEYSTSIGADSAVEFTGGSYSFADGFSFTGREFTVSGDTSFDKVTGGAVAVTGGTLSIDTVELTADIAALSGALLAFSGSGMADLANLVLTVSGTMANRTKYVLATGVKDDSFAVTLNGETYELNVRKDGLLVGVENGELYVQKSNDWFMLSRDTVQTVLPEDGYAFGGSDMHESAVMSVERDLNVATNGQNAGARVYGGGLLRNDALFSGTQKCEVTVTAGGVGKGVIGGNRIESGSIGGTLTSSVTIDSADGTFGFIVGGNQLTGGELNGFGGTSVTIQNGTFSMWICGGSVAGGDAAAQVMGNTNVTITGGTFNGTGVFGGGFVQENGTLNQVGNTNVTISGGTFAGNIYGGHGATNKDASPNGVLFGNTNITISGGIFNGNIYGGGFDQSKVQGDTHITFTGTAGADFSVNGIIDGDASNARYWSKGSFVTGDRYLTFDAFTGEFGATLITNIDQMEVTGGSDVNLKNQLDLSEVSQWEFDFGSSLEGFAQNDLAGDTLVLSGWEDQLGDEGWTVMSGSSITGFGEMEVTNGSNLIFAWNADEQYYLGSIGDEQFKLSMEDGAMKLAKLA